MEEAKKIKEDGEILMAIMKALGVKEKMTMRNFIKSLDLKQTSSIYNITRGEASISDKLKFNILTTYPQVNEEFINFGTGEPLKPGYGKTGRLPEIPIDSPFAWMMEFAGRLANIEQQNKVIIEQNKEILDNQRNQSK